jgi:uncharacterized protein YdcH (DUF465 family)
MEIKDMELIKKYSSSDNTLAELFKRHQEYEVELEKIDNKSYLTVAEQMKRQEIKKQKLAGKDKIEMLLRKYREKEKQS